MKTLYILKALCILITGFGTFMGTCALMTWGTGYTWLAIFTFLCNMYFLSCYYDEDDKNENRKKQSK